jgi:membrane associated rhomboid family serine protease/Flp pilus assembly protein TadD
MAAPNPRRISLANCKQCGTALPAFSFGDATDLCATCSEQAPIEKPKTGSTFDSLPQLNLSPSPWLTATNLLLAVNCLVFLAMLISGVSFIDPSSADVLKWGGNYGPYTLTGQYWRLITCAFVHIGIVHLVFNMYFLFRFGRALEKLFSAWTVIAIYLVTAVGASLLSLTWNHMRVSAGASGALFGFMGVMISVLFNKKLGLNDDDRRRMPGYTVRLAIYNLAYGLLKNIDNMAHLGGFVTGMAIGFFLARILAEKTGDSHSPVALPALVVPPDSPLAFASASQETSRRQRNVLVASSLVVAMLAALVIKAKASDLGLTRAMVLVQTTGPESALPEVRKYVAHHPNDAEGHYFLGLCLSDLDQNEEAQAELERSLAIDPNQDRVKAALAVILVGKDDERAVLLFEKSLSTVEPEATNYKSYARALKATGKITEAKDAYHRALALDSNDRESERELAVLEKPTEPVGANGQTPKVQTLKMGNPKNPGNLGTDVTLPQDRAKRRRPAER